MNKSTGNTTAIAALQTWYSDQCNGEWEHNYGLRIDTLDNPGWSLEIDLMETHWESLLVPFSRKEIDTNSWLQYKVGEGKFQGACDPLSLEHLLAEFLILVE